jgi:HK97 family phage prohead protease
MPTFLVDNHPDLSRVDADTWADAEAKLEGVGVVIGELVEEGEFKKSTIEAEFKFQASDTDTREVVGYGAVFGNVDSYGDVIAPGAFAKSLSEIKSGTRPMPAMLLSHNPEALPVGKWTEMSEDSMGLRVKGFLLDTNQGMDTYKALKAGAITGLSIGFRPIEYALRSKPDEPRRTLKSVDLMEVSVVGFPANDKARVLSVKADDLKQEIKTLSALGSVLREAAGWSRSQTEAVLSNFQAKASQGEPDGEEAKLAALTAADCLIAILKD